MLKKELFLSKILDKASRAENTQRVEYSDFLDPSQRNIVNSILDQREGVNYFFSGGYPGAEREVVVFRPDFISEDDVEVTEIFKLLRVKPNKRDSLSHRDYLGALMGLGIKREKIGDILVGEDRCDIVILREMAEYVSYNLQKVGNTRVDVETADLSGIITPELKVKIINTTVASLRLDCISGAGFGISRTRASELIRGEKLNLNWEITDSVSKQVKEGDTISIKGRGRIVVEKVAGTTRKGRINITIKKMV